MRKIPQAITQALIELGLTDEEINYLADVADDEWDGDVRALCHYVLRSYAPATDLEPGND